MTTPENQQQRPLWIPGNVVIGPGNAILVVLSANPAEPRGGGLIEAHVTYGTDTGYRLICALADDGRKYVFHQCEFPHTPWRHYEL